MSQADDGLNDQQLLRYSRQIMLPDVDVAGQERLAASHVAIIGLGGLGSPASLYLAAAGVGELTLVDHDVVELSNLQRQIVHVEARIGQTKVASAKEALMQLNPDVKINARAEKLDEAGLRTLSNSVDVVVDATDNFAVRYAINQACFAAGTPLVSGAAIRFEGQVVVFDPRDEASPCYQCLYADASDTNLNCAENGVIAPLVGVIGAHQAMEAIKLITGVGESLVGWVLYYDAKYADWRRFKLVRREDCPTCGA